MVVKFRQVFYSIATNGSRIYTFRLLWMDYKRTLEKLKSRNIKVSSFVRKAIAEKINRDYENLKEKPKDEFCPF